MMNHICLIWWLLNTTCLLSPLIMVEACYMVLATNWHPWYRCNPQSKQNDKAAIGWWTPQRQDCTRSAPCIHEHNSFPGPIRIPRLSNNHLSLWFLFSERSCALKKIRATDEEETWVLSCFIMILFQEDTNISEKNEHTLEMRLLKIKTWTGRATQRNLVQNTKRNKTTLRLTM